MEERDLQWMDKYLAGELSGSERYEFELRLQQDPVFRKEMEAYTLTLEALKVSQREELKRRFEQRDKILDKGKPNAHRPMNLWLLAAGILFLLAISWWFYYATKPPAQEIMISDRDSIELKQELPFDSITPDESLQQPEMAEKSERHERGRINTAELFAANFEPYTDETMESISRGDDLEDFEKFQQQYIDRQFPQAIETYKQLPDSFRENDNLKFLYANALLAAGHQREAKPILTEIIRRGESAFATEANYYLALAYLKENNTSEAKRYLQAYVVLEDGVHNDNAKEILHQFEK